MIDRLACDSPCKNHFHSLNHALKGQQHLSMVSVISIWPCAALMTQTSFLLASPLFGPLVLQLRICSLTFVSDTFHTHGSQSERHMLGCSIGSPLLLCEGLLSALYVGSLWPSIGDFCMASVAYVTWLWAKCAGPCY